MSKLKHTPGPWKVSLENEGSIFGDLDNPKHDGDCPFIGTVAGVGPDKKNRECKANAKLIAASPDMVTELNDTHEFLLQLHGALNNRKGLDFNRIQQDLRDRMAKQLHIIDKATK